MNAFEQEFSEKIWQNVDNWKKESGNYMRKTPLPEAVTFLNFLKKNNVKGKLLDIGCGGGRNSVVFANDFDVTGIDFSQTAIKLAKMLAEEKKAKADFIVSDILDFELNSFSAAVDFGCLHHLRKDEQIKYIDNLKKILSKNSYYLLFAFSNQSGKVRGFDGTKNYYEEKGHYTHFFDEDEIKDLLKDFKILKKEIIEKERGKKFYLIFSRLA